MKTKQIVFTDVCKAELLDTELRELNSNEILVETAFSSISCGTERVSVLGDPNITVDTLDPKDPVKFPRYGGYSSSGTVIKLGSEVAGLQVGDRVAMCWTTHSRFNIIGSENVIKLSEGISLREAALFNLATFSLAAIRKTKVELGESMLVMGLGAMGLFSVMLAKAAGAVPVIAVDPIEERREKAMKFGADFALNPTEPDFAKKVKELTGGGAATAIEATGLGGGLDECLDCMAKFGRVALLGCIRNSFFTLDYYRKVHGRGVQLIGAHALARPTVDSHPGYFTQQDDMKALMKLCEGGRINLESAIDETFLPANCAAVYNSLMVDKHFPVISQFDWRNVD